MNRQAATAARAIPSPCVKLCELDAAQICRGCGRALQEIAAWPRATAAQRLDILQAAAARRGGLQQAAE